MTDIASLGYEIDPKGLKAGQKNLEALAKSSDKAEKSAAKFNKTLAKVKVGSGIATAAIGASLKVYKDFGTAIAEVDSLLGDSFSSNALDSLTDSSRELALTFGSNAVDQARAYYQIISAGASTAAEATDILTQSNKLAIGGVTDITTAADGLTSALNAYADIGLTAVEASDSLFVAVKAGKTTIQELSGVMGTVGPVASQLGVSFDEVNAALAAITTTGASTSQAATGLVGILKAVLKPTKEATDLADKLGINFTVAGLKAEGLAGFLDELTRATGGNSTQLAKLFGDVEGLKSVLSLTGGQAQTFTNILEDMADKAGSTDSAFEKLTTGAGELAFEWEKTKSIILDGMLSIGNAAAPAAAKILSAFNSAFTAIKETFSSTEDLSKEIEATEDNALSLSNVFRTFAIGLIDALSPAKDLEDSIDGSKKSSLELSSVWSTVRNGIINTLRPATILESALIDASIAGTELASKFGDIKTTNLARMTNEVVILAEETEEAAESVDTLTDAIDRQQSYLDDFNRAFTDLVDTLDPATAATKDFAREQQILWEAVERGIIPFERFAELNDELIDKLEKTQSELNDTSKEAEVFGGAFDSAKSVIVRSFGDIILEAESLKNILGDIFDAIVRGILDKLGALLVDKIWKKLAEVFSGIFSGDGLNLGGSGNGFGLGSIATWGKTAYDGFKTAASGLGLFGAATTATGASTALMQQAFLEAQVGLEAFGGAGASVAAETVATEAAISNLTSTTLAGVGAFAATAAAAYGLYYALSSNDSEFDNFKQSFQSMLESVETGKSSLTEFGETFQILGDQGTLWVRGPIDGLQALRNELNYSQEGWDAFLQNVGNGEVALRIRDQFDQGLTGLSEIITKIGTDFTGVFDNASGIMDQFGIQTVQVSDRVEQAFDPVLASLGDNWVSLGDRVIQVSDNIEKTVSNTYSNITTASNEFGESASNDIGKVEDSYTAVTKSMVNAIGDLGPASQNTTATIESAFNSAAGVTENASNRMDSALTSAAKNAQSSIQSFSDTSVDNILRAEGTANDLSAAVDAIPDSKRIDVYWVIHGGPPEDRGGNAGGGGFESGTRGRFVKVPSGYPNDSYPIFLSSGEDFMVRTKSDQAKQPVKSSSNPLRDNQISQLNRELRKSNLTIIDLLNQINIKQGKQLAQL